MRVPGRGGDHDRVFLLAVGVLALVTRVAVVIATRHSYLLINDAADYWRLGESIAGGHGFGISHFAPGGGPTALRPPAFPILLGLIDLIAGTHLLVARLFGALLGAIGAVLVMVLARQLCGDSVRPLIAGLLAAVAPPMVIPSTSLMSEMLFVPLSLGLIVAAMAYRRGSPVWLLVCGVLLGLAALTRPVGLVLVVPVVLIVLARRPRPRRHALLVVSAVCLAAAPCLAWEIRDLDALHTVVPLTTQSGYLLAGTYNATSADSRSQPAAWIVPTQDPAIAQLVAAHPHAREVQLGNALQHAATGYATSHPGYIVTVLEHNFLRLFDLTNLAFARAVVQGEYGYGPLAGLIEYICALTLLALAILGLGLGGARGWPWGVALVPLVFVLVTVPVQSFSRFRAPIDPYLVILASAPLAAGVRRFHRALPAAPGAPLAADPHLQSPRCGS